MFILAVVLPLLVRILFLPIKILVKLIIASSKLLEKKLKKAKEELAEEVKKLNEEKEEASKDKKTLEQEKRDLELEDIMMGNSSEKVTKDLSDVDIIQDNIEDAIQKKRLEIALLRANILAKQGIIIVIKLFYKFLNLTLTLVNIAINFSAYFISLLFVGMIVVAVIFVSSGALDFGLVASGTSKPKEEQTDNTATTGDSSKYVEVLKSMAKYEMGDQNSGRVAGDLGDGGGKNYGKYSFTQNYTMEPLRAFLKESYPDLESQLKGATCSAEFDASWQALGEKEDEKFTQAQAEFIVKTVVLPQVDTLKQATGLDLNSGNCSVGAVSIFASMVHQRPAWINELIIPQVKAMGEYTDDKFIEATGGYLRDNYNGNYADALRNRYKNQVEDDKARKDKVKL